MGSGQRLFMTGWDPNDREKTAYHEAGHAIVLWTFGVLPTGRIHLDHEKEEGGCTATDLGAPTRLRPVQQIATWLAGYEAEEAFRPPGRKAKAMIECGDAQLRMDPEDPSHITHRIYERLRAAKAEDAA
jgi:hypothetical protein